MACHHVFALHDAKEKWQRASLLESGRKPPRRWWSGGAAAGALSWGARLGARITPRAVLEKFSAIQMIDVHLPTTDGRTIILSRYTQPVADLQLLLKQLKLELPDQPPPKITASHQLAK